MYRRTDEETMYCSITKISIQSVIGITNNFEALCTSLVRVIRVSARGLEPSAIAQAKNREQGGSDRE